MDNSPVTLSPGAVVAAHASVANDLLAILLAARSNAAQWEIEAANWKGRAEAAEAALAARAEPEVLPAALPRKNGHAAAQAAS